MLQHSIESIRRLSVGKVLRQKHAAGQHITCVSGLIWLTGERQGDVLLKAGERYTMRDAGDLVFEAIANSEWTVSRKQMHLPQAVGSILAATRHTLAQLVATGRHWSQAAHDARGGSAQCNRI